MFPFAEDKKDLAAKRRAAAKNKDQAKGKSPPRTSTGKPPAAKRGSRGC